jgi:hypothetical protein
MLFSVLLMKQHTSGYSCPLSFLHKTAIIPALSAWLYRKYLFYPNKERLSQRLVLLKKSKTPLFEILCRSRPLGPVPVTGLLLLQTKCAAHHFVCRGHSPGIEPKEVRTQGLIRIFSSDTPVFKNSIAV